jgi:hypothetical protein
MSKFEPRIEINGQPLSAAQAMAVRVAVTDFHMWQVAPGTENAEEMGPIAEGYYARLTEVLKLMQEGP